MADGTASEQLQALRICSDEAYEQIRFILSQRNNENEEKRTPTSGFLPF